MTAADVFDAAREYFPAGDPLHTSASILYGWLTRYQRRLLAEIAHWTPGAIATDETIDLATYDFAAGHALPELIRIHGGTVYDGQGNEQGLEIVDFEMRFLVPVPYRPRAYVRGGSLHLLGTALDWTDAATVAVHYFPRGSELTPSAPTLVLPGDPAEACALHLAVHMAARIRQPEGLSDLAYLREESALAEMAYIDDVTGRRRAKVSTTPTIW